MISNPRHASPPRLMAHQPTRFPTTQESSARVHRPESVSEEARARADAKFQKQQKAAEAGAKATEERAAQARAADVHTARLKSLRLAKEADNKEAKAKQSEAPAKT